MVSNSMSTGPSSADAMATSKPGWAVCVAPDHDAEERVVTLVNHAGVPCDLDLTSYAEVCLNQRRADQAHPAFAKLFLKTEFVASSGVLLARRRPRAADQRPIWAVHVTAVEDLDKDALEPQKVSTAASAARAGTGQ
jgi:cellobiose phosphorylase